MQNQSAQSNLEKLVGVSTKKSKMILGTMSGTSMDGLDIAFCRLSDHGLKTKMELLEFHTIPHTEEYKDKIRTVFARADANASSLAVIDQYVAKISAKQILDTLDKWNIPPEEVDLVASHGQTVYHNPAAHPFPYIEPSPITIQLGDGDFIAERTGIITVSDFRQKQIAAGGEGAPLALYGDLLLFSDPEESRILLNIGGIANFTWLPYSKSLDAPLSTDTGPGNTMLDAFMEKHFGLPYDRDAAVGLSGTVDSSLLKSLMDDPFFDRPLPRTTGPELFNLDYLERRLADTGKTQLPKKDIMATLHALTIDSIITAMKPFLRKRIPVYMSGGGLHNPLLIKLLKEKLGGHHLYSMHELGIDPDAKEAVIFALLANECLFGIPENYPVLGTNFPRTSMGKVSFP